MNPFRGAAGGRHIAFMIAMAALPAVLVPAGPPVHAAERQIWFDVPSLPLAKALAEFGIQADISIGYPGLDFGDRKSQALKGYASRETALRALLADSGFSFNEIDSQTFRIVPAPVLAPTTPAIRPEPPRANDWINEVVVTFSRRSRSLETLPYSAEAVTADRLAEQQIRTVGDLTGDVAGVVATNLGPGQNKLSIRGLSDGNFLGHTQSTVGLYLDENRVTFDAPDPDLELVDIDRVEIVRGPQGTLYGAGSIGGLIRIITKKPDLAEFGVSASAETSLTEHGDPSAAASAVINVPIKTDMAGLRVVGYGRRDGGYIDDTRLGRRDVNRVDTGGARLGLQWDLGDLWSISSSASYQVISADDSQYYHTALGKLLRANAVAEPHRNEFFETSMTIRADLPWASLTSSTAFIRHETKDLYDASLSIPAIFALPVTTSAYSTHSIYKTLNHETRLTSAPGQRFDWLAGAFVSHRDESHLSDITFLENIGVANPAYTEDRRDNGDEFALFGEFTYHLTDRLSLTAGLRWFRATVGVTSTTDGAGTPAPGSVTGKNIKTGFTPKSVLSFEADQNLLLYAMVSQGFRLGGVNVDSPISTGTEEGGEEGGLTVSNFDSDTVLSFETGAKSDWFDHHLSVNTAMFFTLWDDIQSDQIRPTGFTYTTNVGDARNYGLELEIVGRPSNDLTLRGSLFINNPELTKAYPQADATSDSGLPGVPRFSLGFSADQHFTLGMGWEGAVGADLAFIGRSHLTFNSDVSPVIGPYHLANLRFSASHSRWRAGIFVYNLTNEGGNTFPFGNPFSARYVDQTTPLRPRSFGLRLERTF